MYAKVFSQIYDGTLCTHGPWQALVTFQQLLVLADQEGSVDMTSVAIARRTTIPLEIIEVGIEALLKPDLHSRTPTEEGRRILPLAEGRTWGWRIVNFKHYRDLKREQDRRDYHREYWHKRKDKEHNQDSTELNSLNRTHQTQPNQPIAEAEAEADKERDVRLAPSGTALKPQSPATSALPDFIGDANQSQIPLRARVKLASKWELLEGWGVDAEALGWRGAEILREAEKFRQYFVSGKGAGTRRTLKGWRQSWSNWLGQAEKYSNSRKIA